MIDDITKEFLTALGQDLEVVKKENPEKYLELIESLKEFYKTVNDSRK